MKKYARWAIAFIALVSLLMASSALTAPSSKFSAHQVRPMESQITPFDSRQDAFFYYSQGMKHLVKEQYDQALMIFSNAIQINEKFAEGYIKRGDAWYLKGDNEMAINDYNTAIALKPDYSESYLGRGLAYKNLGQVKKSEEDLLNACQLGSKEACHWKSTSPASM